MHLLMFQLNFIRLLGDNVLKLINDTKTSSICPKYTINETINFYFRQWRIIH